MEASWQAGQIEDSIKILHIDQDYKVTYFIFRTGFKIQSSVSLERTILLLKREKFDLILSEPHNKAILKPQGLPKEMERNLLH